MSKIGVFPASGGLGGSVVQHLQTLVPASELILIARNPSKLSDAKKAGAAIRQADYDNPSSLENAFDGIHSLMLISYASFEIDHRVKVHRHAIDMAIKSGVKHIFYSSLAFAGISDESVAHVMGAHLATEEYLSKSTDITYTIIREGIYSESFPIYTSWFDLQNPVDEITIPHNGTGPGVAWVKRDKLGEATAKIIASYSQDSSFKYVNKMVLLSGQRVISLAETVEILGRAIGKDIRLREIGIEEYVALPHAGRHTYHGVDLAREWASAWEAIKAGETAVVSSDIVDILGREPERYEDTIRNLAA